MSFNKIVHNFRSKFALRRSLLDILISLEARILRQPPASIPEWPENKRKRFSRPKVTLSYIVSIVFQQMALPICSQGYLIVWEAVVSLPLLVHDILYSFISDGLSLSLHLAVCGFSPVSVLYVLLQCRHFKCSLDMKLWRTLLTGYHGEVWVLGKVLFDMFFGAIIFI